MQGRSGAGGAVASLEDLLSPERTEKLDLYLPETPAPGKLSPAVVWIHGGGWAGGTKNEARAKNICGILANAGYVAVSIDYRLGDGAWPTVHGDRRVCALETVGGIRIASAGIAHHVDGELRIDAGAVRMSGRPGQRHTDQAALEQQ